MNRFFATKRPNLKLKTQLQRSEQYEVSEVCIGATILCMITSSIMKHIVILHNLFCFSDECHYADCCNTGCHDADCHNTECHNSEYQNVDCHTEKNVVTQNVIMQNVTMLIVSIVTVNMLTDIMLNAVMLSFVVSKE